MNIDLQKGNCLDLLKNIPDGSIDFILTDPPYGTTRCKWDTVIPLDEMWYQLHRVIKNTGAIALFCQSPFDKILGCSNISNLRYEWIWEKTAGTGFLNSKKMPIKAHENILIFYKKLPKYNPQKTSGHKPVNSFTKTIEKQNSNQIYGKANQEIIGGGNTDRFPRSVIEFSSDKQKSSLHPTQKPVALLEYFIKTYTDENEVVLDFTMGSGSTAIACLNTNRSFIGMEIEQNYFDISCNRIYEHILHNNIDATITKK